MLSSSCCVHEGVVTTLMWSTLACTVGVGATAALAEHQGWISFQSSISHMPSSSDSVLSSWLQCKLQIKAPNLLLSLHMLYVLHMGPGAEPWLKNSALLYMQASAQITVLPVYNLILRPTAICTEIVGWSMLSQTPCESLTLYK